MATVRLSEVWDGHRRVTAITVIRAALTPLMGPVSMPFTLYFCAIAFDAWFGGFRLALLAIILSLSAGSWLLAAPTRSFFVSGHDDQVAMLMLVRVGLGIALLSRSQRNAIDHALQSENSDRLNVSGLRPLWPVLGMR